MHPFAQGLTLKTKSSIFNIKKKYFVYILCLNDSIVTSNIVTMISNTNQKQILISISVEYSLALISRSVTASLLVVSSVACNLPGATIMVSCLACSFVGPHLQANHMLSCLKLLFSEFTLMCFSFFWAQRRNR